MSLDSTWKCLSVKEFIDDCNWLGLPSEILSEVTELSKSVTQLQSLPILWMSINTQDFFDLSNWDNKPILSNVVDQNVIEEESLQVLSLTLENQQFWQCFAWIEKVESAKIISDNKPNPNSPASQDNQIITLENLSQLF